MNQDPFPTNKTATVVNKGIDGIFKVAVQAVEAGLIVEVPVLANPIAQKIDNAIIEFVADRLYQQFAQWVTFEIIDFQVGHEINDQKKALIALKSAQKSGDQNAIQKALQDFATATVKLTHIDGSATPPHL